MDCFCVWLKNVSFGEIISKHRVFFLALNVKISSLIIYIMKYMYIEAIKNVYDILGDRQSVHNCWPYSQLFAYFV